MSDELTIGELFDLHQERFALVWVAGRGAAGKTLELSHGNEIAAPIVGYMNLVRPNVVQVLGQDECLYLKRLREETTEDVFEQLFREPTRCIVVSDDSAIGEGLVRHGNAADVAVLGTPAPSHQVVDELRHFLAHGLARRQTLHGVFMEVMGAGVLLTGDSGIGKSELALELITRGHRLVADDAPDFALVAPEIIEGTCPPALMDFLEVRGLGVIDVRAIFGDSAVKPRKLLRLIINLKDMRPEDVLGIDRLEGIRRAREVFGVPVPEVTLPVAPGRNMAVLVECTVRSHILRMKGHDAATEFADRQRRLIDRAEETEGLDR